MASNVSLETRSGTTERKLTNTSEPGNRTSDEPVWDLPFLQKDQFFAAAYCLSIVQRNQETLPWAKSRDPRPEATKSEIELLDGIALLFARVKNLKEPTTEGQIDVATNLHVTATAMRVSSVPEENGKYPLTIFIAKNGGAQEVDGIHDAIFKDELENWFNGNLEHNKDMLKIMEIFWQRRRSSYFEQSRTIWTDRFKNKDHVYKILENYCEKMKLDLDKLKCDWNSIMNLDWTAKDFKEYETRGIGIQDYQKPTGTTAEFEMIWTAKNFRKVVKYLQLHPTVRRLWDAFCKFRDGNPDKQFHFEFLEKRSSFSLEQKDVIAVVDSWNEVQSLETTSQLSASRIEKSPSEFEKEKHKTKAKVQREGRITRYYHCELQLLEKLLPYEDVKHYFGCSKLSCFMCWSVLYGSPYRTKGTHAKLYPACAFPFQMLQGNNTLELALALKRTQDRMTALVLARIVNPQEPLPKYTTMTETLNPVMSLSDTTNVRQPQEPAITDGETDNVQQEYQWTRYEAIKIPQHGNPMFMEVDFHKVGDYDNEKGIFCSQNREDAESFQWGLSPLQFASLGLDMGGKRRWKSSDIQTTLIDGIVPSVFYQPQGDGTPDLLLNEYIETQIQQETKKEKSQIERQPIWKGDIYVLSRPVSKPNSPENYVVLEDGEAPKLLNQIGKLLRFMEQYGSI